MTEDQAAGGDAGTVEAEVGRELARARETLHLSLAEAAQQLKFAPRQLEALEQGRFDVLPTGTFARGMVRSYARLLKLDPEPLVARIAGRVAAPDNAEAVASARRPIPITQTGRRTNLAYAGLSIAILAVIVGVVFEWQRERSQAARLTFVPAAQEPARSTPSNTVASTVTPQLTQPIEPQPAPAAQEAAKADAPKTQPALAKAQPDAAGAQADKPAARPGEAHRLVLRFERESWVEVRSRGGKLLMQGLNPGGSERAVEGSPPFTLVIGNAQHVRLSYDDKQIDLAPYVKVEVARFTLE
jgi:cytoskeleton protein RodZ